MNFIIQYLCSIIEYILGFFSEIAYKVLDVKRVSLVVQFSGHLSPLHCSFNIELSTYMNYNYS